MAVPRSSRLFLKEFVLFCPLFCMCILIQTASIFVLFPSSVHLKRMDSAVSEIIVLRAGSLPSITSSFCELSHLFKFLACTHLSPRFLRTCRKQLFGILDSSSSSISNSLLWFLEAKPFLLPFIYSSYIIRPLNFLSQAESGTEHI